MAANAIDAGLSALTQLLKTGAALSRIGQVPGLVGRIPLTMLLVGHCLAVAGMTKNAQSGKLMNFVMGYILAFGGNIIAAYFLGNGTTSVLFSGNETVLIWTASWWLLNYNPVPVVDDVLDSAPVGIGARASVHILRAMNTANQVNVAAKMFPGAIAPAIVAGTIGAAGGKLAYDSLESIAGAKGSHELAKPGFVLRSAVVNSALSYALVHYLKAFTQAEGLGLLLVTSLVYTLTDDLTAKALDISEHITQAFTTVTLITRPSKARGRTTAAAPAARASSSKRKSTSRRRK